MNRSIYWATIAQVVPVALAILGVELVLVRRFPWSRSIYIRAFVSVMVVGLYYVEYRALTILGGKNEFFSDQVIANSAIIGTLGMILGITVAAVWAKRD